jgi:TMEM175 potassium channel family protein
MDVDADGLEDFENVARYDTVRVEAFSDAVFAVAMTVLAVELLPPEHQPGDLLHALLDQWPAYASFLASFLYVGVMWMNHHATFTRIRRMDRGLRFANLGILLWTVLIPFPTAVMADTLQERNLADSRAAVALYALIGALMCASWLVFFHYLTSRPHMAEEDVPDRFFHAERTRAWVGVALYCVAGVLGTAADPLVALAIFVALPVFYAVTSEGLLEMRWAGERTRRK